jgi:hypothetical protein
MKRKDTQLKVKKYLQNPEGKVSFTIKSKEFGCFCRSVSSCTSTLINTGILCKGKASQEVIGI